MKKIIKQLNRLGFETPLGKTFAVVILLILIAVGIMGALTTMFLFLMHPIIMSIIILMPLIVYFYFKWEES